MNTAVGTFQIEDSFNIIGRGLVLLGKVSGQVASGYQLVFEDGTQWNIRGIKFANLHNQYKKFALLVDAPVLTREELLQRGIMWNFAQIFPL